jgi:hypothetical protein
MPLGQHAIRKHVRLRNYFEILSTPLSRVSFAVSSFLESRLDEALVYECSLMFLISWVIFIVTRFF